MEQGANRCNRRELVNGEAKEEWDVAGESKNEIEVDNEYAGLYSGGVYRRTKHEVVRNSAAEAEWFGDGRRRSCEIS